MKPDPQKLTAVREPGDWAPDSWLGKPVTQQPEYPDAAVLNRALVELRELPPLVTSWEVLALKRKLSTVHKFQKKNAHRSWPLLPLQQHHGNPHRTFWNLLNKA